MLRKVITIIVALVALILLFLLIRAAVGAFTNDPEPDVPVQTEATISDPIDIDVPGSNDAPATEGQTLPSTNGNANAPGRPSTSTGKTPAAASQELAKSGAAETAMVTIAATTALGTMLYVRRRQLASL